MALLIFLVNALEIFFCFWACRTVWGEYADGSPFCGLLQYQLVLRLPTPISFIETTVRSAVIALSILIWESGMTAVLTAHIDLEDNCNACTCFSAGSSSVWLPSLLLIFYMDICKSMPVFHTIEGPGGLQFKNAIILQAMLLQRHRLK